MTHHGADVNFASHESMMNCLAVSPSFFSLIVLPPIAEDLPTKLVDFVLRITTVVFDTHSSYVALHVAEESGPVGVVSEDEWRKLVIATSAEMIDPSAVAPV